jgi:hypothetical protein
MSQLSLKYTVRKFVRTPSGFVAAVALPPSAQRRGVTHCWTFSVGATVRHVKRRRYPMGA